jgi:hypothetical protein
VSNPDPEVTIRLRLSQWDVVWAHLLAGIYRDVADVLADISQQADPQIEAATKASMGVDRAAPKTDTPTTEGMH